MKKAFFKIFALGNFLVWAMILPLHAESKSFFLGENFVPSSIHYSDLAQAIDQRFEDLENVEVVSLSVPLMQKLDNWISNSSEIGNLELYFRTKIIGEDIPHFFTCKMDVVRILRDGGWKVDFIVRGCKCNTSENFIIRHFVIRDIVNSFNRVRFIN